MCASALIFASVLSSQVALGQTIIPAVRNFAWNPGNDVEGRDSLPHDGLRDSVAKGGQMIQRASKPLLDSCPANQVVMLNAGTFIVNSTC